MSTTEIASTLERATLKRRLSRWRILAIVLGVTALAALFWSGGGDGRQRQDHIARISITGMITDDRKQLELLDAVGKASTVKAVVLAINSPGGTTAGGEALYEAISKLGKKKPVVAVQGTIATSAAYMASLPAERIFARGSTITGSVGVIVQFPEVSEALSKLGIKMHEIKSGSLKASPSTFQPLDEGGRALLDQMVKEGQAWFLGLVKTSRKIDTLKVPGLEQGAVFSGRKALEYRLIDEIGGEETALSWLQTNKNVSDRLEVVDWRPQDDATWHRGWLAIATKDGVNEVARSFGEGLVTSVLGEGPTQSLQLDGLLSVWQPH